MINKLFEQYQHRAAIHHDGKPDDTIVFRWHWPRGTFDYRMSALEIATFVLPHMPSILPFFHNYPDVYAEFSAMLQRLITWPAQVLDEVTPWIRRLEYTEEDEILELNLRARKLPPKTEYFT